MISKFSSLKIIAISSLVAGCNINELPKIKGRYLGLMKIGSDEVQVIANVPDFKKEKNIKSLSFNVYPILATAIADRYKFTLLNAQTVEMKNSHLRGGIAYLNPTNNCLKGISDTQNISACWEENKMTLSITDITGMGKSFFLELKLDDNLSFPGKNKIFTVDELLGRAKFNNYTVTLEAEKVFQAQRRIGVARTNLIPKLSLGSLVGVAAGDYLSSVGSVLPFLIPNNWYKWKTSKDLYQAEKKSFASLRGNEMNMVENLYYIILRDQSVLIDLKNHIAWMKQLEGSIRQAERVGIIVHGIADYFSMNIAALEKDKNNFEGLIKIQYAELAQGAAVSSVDKIGGLVAMSNPDLSLVDNINPEDFLKEAQSKSYELLSFVYLKNVAQTNGKGIYFDFFDLNGNGGIGFGSSYKIEISKSEVGSIDKKMAETRSLIELQAVLISNQHNQALTNYQLVMKNKTLVEKRLNWLVARLLQGDATINSEDFINQLTDAQFKIMSFKADLATCIQEWMIAKAKKNRLLLEGYYSDLEAGVPEESLGESK